ncbi:hypothetical protein GCM10022223_53990 [Kineosporia mesophila]|uniref:Biotin carboxyl carrier protein of acetyl-CoA carboxylase n=2 Tax=Kineosporia mesophila TaxID=566012 RepID=A0ABP7ACI5_9ACTN
MQSEPDPGAVDITDQALLLARQLPGQVRRISVRHGRSSVEIDWHGEPGGAAPAVAARSDGGTPDAPAGAGVHAVPSPLVGTFYRAPSPGASTFVEVGSAVQTGQTLGIVEAMKLMNPIICDVAGQVLELPVADGESVQFGQTLVRIAAAEPAGPVEGG